MLLLHLSEFVKLCQDQYGKLKYSELQMQRQRNKIRWNRTFRKVCRKLIRLEKETPVKIHSIIDVWDGAKDGKRYFKDATIKDMRK